MRKFLLMPVVVLSLLFTACGGNESNEGDGKESSGDTKAQQEEKIDFKLAVKEGDSYQWVMSLNEETATTDPEMGEVKMTNNMTFTLDINTQEVGEGKVVETTAYSHVKASGSMGPGQEWSVDTNEESDAPMAQYFANMLGKVSTITMDDKGGVQNVAGMKEMMAMTFPDSSYDGNQNLMETLNLDACFPAQPVAIGESWTSEKGLRAMYPMIVENTFTLKEKKENGNLLIELKGVVKPNPNEYVVTEMGPDGKAYEMKYEFNGTRTGWYEVDPVSFRVVKQEITYELDGNAMRTPAEGGETVKMPMKVKRVDAGELKPVTM